MIRMGGTSSEPRLDSYSEKNASRSLPLVHEARSALDKVHRRLESYRTFFIKFKSLYLDKNELETVGTAQSLEKKKEIFGISELVFKNFL